jgi:hypothetical protein
MSTNKHILVIDVPKDAGHNYSYISKQEKQLSENIQGQQDLMKEMKLEHKKQKVIPISRFLIRLGRYGLFALLLIMLSVLLGTIGYHLLGQLGWIDSFQMACMILTGMGPVVEMPNDEAKIFSSLYALYSGIAFVSITAVFFAPIIHRLLHILHVEETRPPS